ncbi:MAG: hypothetical protein WA056_03860, partial [Gallionella sp.]
MNKVNRTMFSSGRIVAHVRNAIIHKCIIKDVLGIYACFYQKRKLRFACIILRMAYTVVPELHGRLTKFPASHYYGPYSGMGMPLIPATITTIKQQNAVLSFDMTSARVTLLPSRAEPSRAEPSRAEPSRAEPSR